MSHFVKRELLTNERSDGFGPLQIASEHSSRRGRQRTDLHEIHDPVVQDDDLQELMVRAFTY